MVLSSTAAASGLVADVVYESSEGYDRAFSLKDSHSYVPGSAPIGAAKWRSQYLQMRPDNSALQKQVDMFLHAFDQRSETEKLARKSRGPIVDEDGFTLVQSNTKRKAEQSESSARGAAKKFKQKLQKQAENAVHFYKFQEKERKLERINVMRRKFEEDKQKLIDLKATRKFKPF